jgi:site-specific recombinase XerD
VLIGCGLRVSGVCALNESSLLWSRGQDGVEDLTILVTEKGKKDRLVPAPHETALLLRAYLGHQELEAINRQIAGDRVLFVTTNNRNCPEHEYHGERRRMTPWAVADMLDRVGERAKVPRSMRNPHAFRHLYGTEMTEGDVVTLQLQGLMGHANPKDTEIYARLARRKLREAVDRANPLAKMRGPLLDSLRAIGGQQRRARASSAPPRGPYNSDRPGPHDPEA